MIKKRGDTISVLIILTVLGQVISFFRESIFAYYYGTGIEADSYVMASQIPVTIFAIVTTSISTVALPIYTRKVKQDNTEEAETFLKSLLISILIVCGTMIVFAELFTNIIVKLFAPGYTGEQFKLTVTFSRLMFPTILFSVLISIITVTYNSEGKFVIPICFSFFQNTMIILCMFFFGKTNGAEAAVWGTVFGIVLNAIFLTIPKVNVFKAKTDLIKLRKDIKEVLVKIIPVTIGVGIAEINRIIDRAIASGLDTGSVTALNYANKLTIVFSSLILSAISTVAFKIFSDCRALNDSGKAIKSLYRYLRVLFVFLLPLSFGAIYFKRQLIYVVFARGEFDDYSFKTTVDVFGYYAFGILFIALREILSKYFYANGNTKTPMYNAGAGVVLNIILNIVLSKIMGAAGLAFATTISCIVVCLMLFISIKIREKELKIVVIIKDFFVSLLCSAIMMLAPTYPVIQK